MILLQSYSESTGNPGRSTWGKPYDSLQGLESRDKLVLFGVFVIVVIYFAYRFWKSKRNEQRRRRVKNLR